MSLPLLVSILSALYVAAWIPIAYATDVLFPQQMLRKYPDHRHVIPLIVDFYIWSDLLIFPPLFWYILTSVGSHWSGYWVMVVFVTGAHAAMAFQRWIIIPGKYPSTLGGAGKTTLLGWLHLPFFAVAWTILWMFVLTSVPTNVVFTVAAAFAVIVPTNILVPLHLCRKWFNLRWAPDVFGEEPRLFFMIGTAWVATLGIAITKIALQH